MLKVAEGAPLSIEARVFGGVYVQTATVVVEGPNGWHKTIVYIDQGSNATLIRSIRAIDSKLGWLLLGKDEKVAISSTTAIGFLLKAKLGTPEDLQEVTDPKNEEIDFARWWKLESLDPLEKVPLAEQWKTYAEAITQAPLPWIGNKRYLSKNEGMAEGQAKALIRRLDRDRKMKTSYEAEFSKLKELRFISKADTSFDGIYTILPHHPVVRRDKTTSRVRPVFNGSAKPKTGFSANDCLEEGPNLSPDILDVMLLFRLNPIAWTADIRQAFLM
ncbi:hypothetical protein GHT06_008906 [Daphnia sinensis]|uniref:Peptidase A2 domain-containing protein n=1 Tax=Daphnia sinensis TaxID=1820382 RepID=A0AAD5LLX9_9CRUS|nr:hypothetical protein GHT06_008906 [Daphnia sinensis]